MRDEFDSTIQGIPCRVIVAGFAEPVPSNRQRDPLDDPHDCGEFTFSVYDRRGYPAAWLERMMTRNDADRIYQEYRHGLV